MSDKIVSILVRWIFWLEEAREKLDNMKLCKKHYIIPKGHYLSDKHWEPQSK